MSRHSSILIVICLLLGVITTLLIAWACAAIVNPERVESTFSHSPRADGGDDVIVAQRGFGHTRLNRAQCDQLIIDEATGNIRLARWKAGGETSSESRAGWPLRAFTCENPGNISIVTGSTAMTITTMSRSAGAAAPSSTVRGGWELPAFGGKPLTGMAGVCWRAIPLRPIWGGFALDTLIFAIAWLTLLTGVASLRRNRRRSRGLCPWCAYDLRSAGIVHARCPECGRHATRGIGSAAAAERAEVKSCES